MYPINNREHIGHLYSTGSIRGFCEREAVIQELDTVLPHFWSLPQIPLTIILNIHIQIFLNTNMTLAAQPIILPTSKHEIKFEWGSAQKASGNFGTVVCKCEDAIEGDFNSIPLIDVAGIFSSNLEDRKAVAAQLRDACINVGFFYVKNHGITKEMVDGVFEWGKKFFDLDFEEKMEVYIDNVPNYRGYTPLHGAGIAGLDGKGSQCEPIIMSGDIC
jgi:hypothetical protein